MKFVSRDNTVWAVNGVSFRLMPGEVLCLIGESGSGKSVTMRALMRLLPRRRAVLSGRVRVGGRDVLALGEAALTQMRGSEIAMVFQEPMTALDPVYTIGDQIAETVMRHEGCSRRAAMARALELLRAGARTLAGAAARRLSARTVGRLAPARHHCGRVVVPAEPAARRRAYHRARRHRPDPGADPVAQAAWPSSA